MGKFVPNLRSPQLLQQPMLEIQQRSGRQPGPTRSPQVRTPNGAMRSSRHDWLPHSIHSAAAGGAQLAEDAPSEDAERAPSEHATTEATEPRGHGRAFAWRGAWREGAPCEALSPGRWRAGLWLLASTQGVATSAADDACAAGTQRPLTTPWGGNWSSPEARWKTIVGDGEAGDGEVISRNCGHLARKYSSTASAPGRPFSRAHTAQSRTV